VGGRGERQGGRQKSHEGDLAPAGLIGLGPHIFLFLSTIEADLGEHKNMRIFKRSVGRN
jgi:hypothetical protein